MKRSLHTEDGSLPMAMIAVIIVAGLVTTVLASVVSGHTQTRFDDNYETALQVSEDGLDRAKVMVTSRAQTDSFCLDSSGTVTVGACTAPVPAGGYQVEAVKDTFEDWQLMASGESAGIERSIAVVLDAETVFSLAAFGKFFADFNGGNGADSYMSGTWDYSTSPASFTEDPAPLLCSGVICPARKTGNGIIATNGRLKLKGEVAANTDGFEVHFAMESDKIGGLTPRSGATGFCDGVPATCNEWPSGKLSYFRDEIALPLLTPECDTTGTLPDFPNASTGNVLPAGPVCFDNVELDSDTLVDGTPTNPTRIYMRGTLRVGNDQTVNFAGTKPRPALTLQIFSEDTGDVSLDFGNHAAFAGAIFAPNAGFAGGAQGEFYGSLIAGSINNNGGWNFHYDEALSDAASNAPYAEGDWVEVAP